MGNSRHTFLTPAIAFIFLLSAFPLAFSLGMTFTNWNLGFEGIEFVGLANWGRLFGDPRFLGALANTAFFLIVGIVLQYTIALVLAVLVLSVKRGRSFFRIVFLLPMMMSSVAIAFIIGQMVLSETQGPVAAMLEALGIGHVPWISDPALAPWTIMLVDTWHWSAFVFVVLLAGLQSLPQESVEAARVDGANRWQIFWQITFPLLMPVTVTVIFIRSLELFKILEAVRVITGGGPGLATDTITLFIYDTSLRYGDVSYGATIAYALLILVAIFSVVYLTLTRSAVERVVG